MSSRASVSRKPKPRLCPSACGFSLSETDTHEVCPVCLGMLHAKAALADPEVCAHCRRLRKSTLERRVAFLTKVLGSPAARDDPMLSEAAESPAGMDLDGGDYECSAGQSWGDHMDALHPTAEYEGAEEDPVTYTVSEEVPPLGVLSEDELSLAASGGFSEGEAEAGGEEDGGEQSQVLNAGDFPTEADGSTPALIDLCRRAAERLEVPWPAPPPRQQQTRLAGNYFLPRQTATVRHKLPVFADFTLELSRSWASPKAPLSLPFSQFLDLEGMEAAGLTNIPPMDDALASHLAPKSNTATGKPTLPSRQCRFSASQLEKIYRAQGLSARALNTASMLQAYQAEKLRDLHEALTKKESVAGLLDEVRRTADFILRLSSTAAVALGKGMADTVVAQRHLWLTLTELPEAQRSEFLHQAVEPSGLFGQALDKIQARCDLRKKQEEALRMSMPRRAYAQPKPSSDQRRARPHSQSLSRRAQKRPSPEDYPHRQPSAAPEVRPQPQPKQSTWAKHRFVPKQVSAPKRSHAEGGRRQTSS